MSATHKYSVSTYALIDLSLEAAVACMLERGCRAIEIMCEGRHGELLNWSDDRLYRLKQIGQENGISWSIHAPIAGMNLAAEDESTIQATAELLHRTVYIANLLECTHIVVHPGELPLSEIECGRPEELEAKAEELPPMGWAGQSGQPDKDAAALRAAGVLKQVLAANEASKMILALENVPPYPGLLGTDALFLEQIVQHAGAGAGIVFDVGHAHLMGEDQCLHMLQKLMPYLVGVHWSDNHGQYDEHLPLGAGTVPLKEAAQLLQESGFSGAWVLEVRSMKDAISSAEWLEMREFPKS